MTKNKIGFIVASISVILILSGAACNKSKTQNNDQQSQSDDSSQSQVAGDSTDYFAEDAKVMYFYSDFCSWCKKEKEVLKELAPDGYKVKPMDVAKDTNLWQKYNIEGTPTFIAPDGTRLVGYQDKDKLKAFLDKYK